MHSNDSSHNISTPITIIAVVALFLLKIYFTSSFRNYYIEEYVVSVEIVGASKVYAGITGISNGQATYKYEGRVLYNGVEYEIEDMDTYVYCLDMQGKTIDAKMTEYYYGNRFMQQEINFLE
jgi:hypothetical protein